jgi:hypothetical protein
MSCFCFLSNVLDAVVKRGETFVAPFQARFNDVYLERYIMSCGCEVENHPINPEHKTLQHSLALATTPNKVTYGLATCM